MKEKQRKSVRDAFAEKFISILESDRPWQWTKEWSTGNYALPYNGQTGRKYNGINRFILMFQVLEKASAGLNTPNATMPAAVMKLLPRNGTIWIWMNFIRNVPRSISEKLLTTSSMALPAIGFQM